MKIFDVKSLYYEGITYERYVRFQPIFPNCDSLFYTNYWLHELRLSFIFVFESERMGVFLYTFDDRIVHV